MESSSTSLIARKRKQPQSSLITTPRFSSFNRSKSLRSDIAFTSPADDEDSSRHTVKLLCSRRVFSPDPRDNGEESRNSIPDSCEPRQNLQMKQSESTCILNQGSSGFNYDAENCGGGMLNPVDDGVNVQTTPPEAVVGSLEAAANASQVADPTISAEPAAKYKGRLNPRFRGRLVKSPVSFSYRRLLPYLMDIAKVDDSGATTTNACKKQQNTQGGTTLIQKAPEDVICCNGDNPTANGSSKEVAAIIGHVNGGSSSPSDESPRDLSPPIVMNHTCSSESKGQYLKYDEDEGKFDHSSGNEKVPAENKPVEDVLILHPLNNNVDEISKPCLKEEDTNGTKEVVLMSQIDNSDFSEVSGAQGNTRLLQSSTLHSNNADFVTSTVSMKSIDKSPLKNKKMLLNPCSRLKLSKSTNNSFSYKRLLPYLMEIAKDNSAGAASESPSLTEELKKTQQHSPPHQQFEEEQVALRMPPPSTIIISSSDSILLKDDNNVSPASSSTAVEPPQGLVLEAAVSTSTTTTNTRSLDEKLELSNEKEKRVDLISPVVEQPLIGGSPDTTTEVDRLILVQEEEASPPKSERESIRIGQIGSTTKGILKRKNPRGCRGLCTCLSCSSFRLNAEKAFEFSRNQMKDTEEVAFALMEEVSHLRNVLQKLNNTTHQVMSNDQVEDACVRASQVEEAAKDRLRLMNEDLNIHCRIKCLHPPSVTFKEPPSVTFDKP